MIALEPNTAEGFVANFDPSNSINRKRAQLGEWESIDLVFQLTGERNLLERPDHNQLWGWRHRQPHLSILPLLRSKIAR